MRISDWSSDVCSSDLAVDPERAVATVFTALEAAGAEVARHRDPAVLPKAIKNDTELGGTRAAHVRDGVAVARFLKWMEETAPQGGLDELGAAAKLRAFRDESDALVDLSFDRSEEHTSELQSLMRTSYAVFCLKKQNSTTT